MIRYLLLGLLVLISACTTPAQATSVSKSIQTIQTSQQIVKSPLEQKLDTFQGKIKIDIREKTAYGDYHDSLYFTPKQFMLETNESISTKIQERVNNWINIVKNPPPYVEPTLGELQNMKLELQGQIKEIDDKIALIAIPAPK